MSEFTHLLLKYIAAILPRISTTTDRMKSLYMSPPRSSVENETPKYTRPVVSLKRFND